MSKEVTFGSEARNKMLKGVDILADAVNDDSSAEAAAVNAHVLLASSYTLNFPRRCSIIPAKAVSDVSNG